MQYVDERNSRTAICSLLFHVRQHSKVLAKLQHELEGAIPSKDTVASWDAASKLPYLDACIKETMRLHPPTGFLMERVVPPEGAVICGEFIPGGTTVGCIPWVMHRHRPTFGDDVEDFRPERWIEASPEQRAAMDKVWCPFGFQSRLCMGMNMGLFELYKITATLLNRYQVSRSSLKTMMGQILTNPD